MGRPSLPAEVQQKIREMVASGGGIKPTARALNLSPISVERVLFPDRVRRREKKKTRASIIRLDRQELPENNFDIYEKENWLIG